MAKMIITESTLTRTVWREVPRVEESPGHPYREPAPMPKPEQKPPPKKRINPRWDLDALHVILVGIISWICVYMQVWSWRGPFAK